MSQLDMGIWVMQEELEASGVLQNAGHDAINPDVSHCETGTVSEEGGVSFQEHIEFWGSFFIPTAGTVEAWGGVVYWEHRRP